MDLEKFIDSGFNHIDALEDLYARYQENPKHVPDSWQEVFRTLDRGSLNKGVKSSGAHAATDDGRIINLIQAYRTHGHLMAHINPLSETAPAEPWELNSVILGFEPKELSASFRTFGLLKQETASLSEIIAVLRSIYCNTVGVEYMGLHSLELEEWIQERIEPGGFKENLDTSRKQLILEYLNKSELFESFIHTKYPGQKRFSLEGAETLIPMLAAIVDKGAELGAEEYIIGMAHRGRLNVLANILNKPYGLIFSEFEEGPELETFDASGDVKYHKGFYSQTFTSHGHKVEVTLTPNPSHLESVDPVVEGQTYAGQQLRDGDDCMQKVIPLLIHGDAALAGQGIVYETLQLYKLDGYKTGGTLHLVVNNQIGFTTVPQDSRSTTYCTDIAHGFGAPVFHMNAEDPEGCVFAALMALEIRRKFACDVFLDLMCWRKYGHNESDEPAYTQPVKYGIIRKKRPIRELYRDTLISQGVLEKTIAEKLESEFKASLQEAMTADKTALKKVSHHPPRQAALSAYGKPSLFHHQNTGVLPSVLLSVARGLSVVPEGFTINPKVEGLVKDRLSMVSEAETAKPIDWGMAELLAYGSLLWQGVDIRLTGQDCRRGTFSHRHAVWVDQTNEKSYCPLQHLKSDQGHFEVINSPLSEYAALGFEFGYSLTRPDALVLWEAQFGDFSNGAQIVIDQYLATAEQKWGQKFGLVLLLPHGYEGQGPEHSSARIERYLTLAGNENMQIVYPTTPAQFFHLLRRQIMRPWRKPLIVFTPKGLLRHPACVSSLIDLTQGSFQEIIDDPQPPTKVRTLVLCTGRIYYDLVEARANSEQKDDLAIVRIEQLYPFHIEKMRELLEKYRGFEECIWLQEEPANMGAAEHMRGIMHDLLPENRKLRIISRSRSASPAVGSYAQHKKEHRQLMDALFKMKQPTIFDLASKKGKT